MGETISYGGGKVPDVAELVREARQKYNDTLPSHWRGKAQYGHRQILDWYGYLELCGALEEKEREVSSLRVALTLRDGDVEDLEREVERLRWFYENMRDADRRNLQMEYEAGKRS